MGATAGNQDQALAELAGDWPRWHFWRGVGGLWYARRLRRSPPAVLRDAEAQGLAAKVKAWEDSWRGSCAGHVSPRCW